MLSRTTVYDEVLREHGTAPKSGASRRVRLEFGRGENQRIGASDRVRRVREAVYEAPRRDRQEGFKRVVARYKKERAEPIKLVKLVNASKT